jgi:mannonate dehydratase
MILNSAAAGIPSIKYNMSILGVLRIARSPGRGDATYSTWKLKEAHPSAPLTRRPCGRGRGLGADYVFSRARGAGSRRIQDPNCLPPARSWSAARRLPGRCVRTGNGGWSEEVHSDRGEPVSRFELLPGNGFGNAAESGQEIFDVLRYFGLRQKIFNVHFRNIRVHRDEFMEVFPDEGDVNFVKAIQVYKEVRYPYLLMPDHVPEAADDPAGLQSFAYCYGYIQALIQAVNQI